MKYRVLIERDEDGVYVVSAGEGVSVLESRRSGG
jgi:predicted RNase H-like HicB family nuclease